MRVALLPKFSAPRLVSTATSIYVCRPVPRLQRRRQLCTAPYPPLSASHRSPAILISALRQFSPYLTTRSVVQQSAYLIAPLEVQQSAMEAHTCRFCQDLMYNVDLAKSSVGLLIDNAHIQSALRGCCSLIQLIDAFSTLVAGK